MSKLSKLGWDYIPNIITKDEAIQIKYENYLGAIHDLGGLKTHFDKERGDVMCCYAPPSSTYVVKRAKPILENLLGEEDRIVDDDDMLEMPTVRESFSEILNKSCSFSLIIFTTILSPMSTLHNSKKFS